MRRVVPYPLLLLTSMILDRVAISISQIDPKQSLRFSFILLTLSILALFIIQHFVRDRHRTNFIAFLFVTLFIVYRPLYSTMVKNYPQQADILGIALIPLLGGLYAILIHRKLWQYIRTPSQITNYLNLVCAILFMFQVTRVGESIYAQMSFKTGLMAIPQMKEEIHLKRGTNPPDIYIIILDAYGRQDVLQSIYNYDNSGFIGELEKRGFFVPMRNHSNYVQTVYAMASLWNFDYVQPWTPPSDYRQYLIQPIQNNRAFQLLDEIGYTTVSFEGTLSYTQIYNADVYLSDFLPLNKFEALSLVDTPMEPISNILDLRIPIPTYRIHRERIQYKLDMMKKVPGSIPGPKIVYNHILLPHPPFVFDRNGNALPQQEPYKMWDDSETAGGMEDYQKGYREQIIFANKEILEDIDAILAKSKTPPIILLMGDHGPASMFQFDIDQPGCVWERTSNLYALLLPGHQNDGTLYSTISPVNTFRVIFNSYFGTKLPLLGDRTYLAASQYRSKIRDVTDQRDSRQSCTISDN